MSQRDSQAAAGAAARPRQGSEVAVVQQARVRHDGLLGSALGKQERGRGGMKRGRKRERPRFD